MPAVPGRDRPCSGPSCSRDPDLPAMPAGAPSVLSDPWCCTAFVPPLTGPARTDRPADSMPRAPRHAPAALERPPRLTSPHSS